MRSTGREEAISFFVFASDYPENRIPLFGPMLYTGEIDDCKVSPYSLPMIRSFRSKALSRYWTKADASGLRPDWVKRIRLVMSRLDVASTPQEMDVPGFGLHALLGDQAGRLSVTVSRNLRITFAFDGEDAVEVDLEDYHG